MSGYPLQAGVSDYIRISVAAGVSRCVRMTVDLREGRCTAVEPGHTCLSPYLFTGEPECCRFKVMPASYHVDGAPVPGSGCLWGCGCGTYEECPR